MHIGYLPAVKSLGMCHEPAEIFYGLDRIGHEQLQAFSIAAIAGVAHSHHHTMSLQMKTLEKERRSEGKN
jgi:hypothetical protein